MKIKGINGELDVFVRGNPVQRRHGRIGAFFGKFCKSGRSRRGPEGRAVHTDEEGMLAW